MDWYYTSNNKEFGPVSFDTLRLKISQEVVKATDMVRGPGVKFWTPVLEVEIFKLARKEQTEEVTEEQNVMESEMTLPPYYDLVRIVAQIGAALSCLAGVVVIIVSFASFKFGFMAGMKVLFSGTIIIVYSLVALGVTYCFLTIVKAQIESRNAIVSYTSNKKSKA